MSYPIESSRNETATSRVALPRARRVAGIAINVLGAIVLFSESFRFLNAGL